jgi:alpha-L-fucosidase
MRCSPVTTATPVPRGAAGGHANRLQWWREAKFGMFVHWGLYSVLGRGEWALELDAIPSADYERLADRFAPGPDAARRWTALAKRAGMRYVVLTTKHHDGFCLFDSAVTEYCATRRACGRDLVREFVDAARAAGLRVGLYYSLMDWHHPDAAAADRDEAARRRLVEYAHGQLRELLTNYGTIDILWYDSPWPLDSTGWDADRMNEMAVALQPRIVVNDRNGLSGDFSTFEQHIPADTDGRAWETCTTTNQSWGFHAVDDWWKAPKELVHQLVTCARDGGNYLLNIGPRSDGSVPEPAVDALSAVGDWLARNGDSIYGAERCHVRYSTCASFTQKGRTLFVHVRHWPGETLVISGLQCRVSAAHLLACGERVAFEQDGCTVRFCGLPPDAPDSPITTLAVECAEPPQQIVRGGRGVRRGRLSTSAKASVDAP